MVVLDYTKKTCMHAIIGKIYHILKFCFQKNMAFLVAYLKSLRVDLQSSLHGHPYEDQ